LSAILVQMSALPPLLHPWYIIMPFGHNTRN
jgi:hypothetical protein